MAVVVPRHGHVVLKAALSIILPVLSAVPMLHVTMGRPVLPVPTTVAPVWKTEYVTTPLLDSVMKDHHQISI